MSCLELVSQIHTGHRLTFPAIEIPVRFWQFETVYGISPLRQAWLTLAILAILAIGATGKSYQRR
jgi:hypothetical protein